jgi:hypothetical protein
MPEPLWPSSRFLEYHIVHIQVQRTQACGVVRESFKTFQLYNKLPTLPSFALQAATSSCCIFFRNVLTLCTSGRARLLQRYDDNRQDLAGTVARRLAEDTEAKVA